MRKPQENKFTMAKAVDTYLDENETIVSGVPELHQHHISLKSKCAEIESMNIERKTVAVGKLLVKLSERKDAIVKAMSISGALFAYGKKINNNELTERAYIVKSTLDKMRDTELVGKFRAIRDLANEHITALEPFGISALRLTSFSEKIDLFEAALGQKESSIAQRKGAIKSLKKLFTELDDTLLSLDKLVDGLVEEHPALVSNYYFARIIKNVGLRHRKDNPPGNLPPQENPQPPENPPPENPPPLENPGNT